MSNALNGPRPGFSFSAIMRHRYLFPEPYTRRTMAAIEDNTLRGIYKLDSSSIFGIVVIYMK